MFKAFAITDIQTNIDHARDNIMQKTKANKIVPNY